MNSRGVDRSFQTDARAKPVRPGGGTASGALGGEAVLSWVAAAVGVIGIVSAVTPELAGRYDFVRGVLPPGVPHVARIAALAFGLALVWLSRSLARRRKRAWQLAVVSAIGATLALEAQSVAFDRAADALSAVALLLGFRALHLWLRPLSERVRQSAEERRHVRELVRRYGDDSLSFFALRRDKSWFLSPTRRSFLAYRVVGGAALVSGDPIGDEHEFAELLAEFQRVCHARGWRLALLSVRAELLPAARHLGLRAIKIGDEAVVQTERFSLEGRAIRKVRQSVARLERNGYRFRVVAAADVDAALRSELEHVSACWRGSSAERGFSMAMDDPFREPETLFAVAETDEGVGGFLHLVPAANGRAYSLGAMRRLPSTPNGMMEFPVVETIGWARERNVQELSLNFCAFADVLRGDSRMPLLRMLRGGLRIADGMFQIERLFVFNRKFQPEWRPRYLCFERFSDLGLVGLAYLRVESLLTPPGPWTRRQATPTG